MSLLAQLEAAAAARPLPSDVPPHPRLANLRKGGPSQSEKAIARYHYVMNGRGWMTQREIENAMGYGTCTSSRFLHKLLDQGLLERRNRGGAETYNRKSGYEWRWKA